MSLMMAVEEGGGPRIGPVHRDRVICPASTPAASPASPHTGVRRARATYRSAQALLEPVVGVGLGVEGGNLPVARGSIHANGFLERAIGFETQRGHAELAGLSLQRLQHP